MTPVRRRSRRARPGRWHPGGDEAAEDEDQGTSRLDGQGQGRYASCRSAAGRRPPTPAGCDPAGDRGARDGAEGVRGPLLDRNGRPRPGRRLSGRPSARRRPPGVRYQCVSSAAGGLGPSAHGNGSCDRRTEATGRCGAPPPRNLRRRRDRRVAVQAHPATGDEGPTGPPGRSRWSRSRPATDSAGHALGSPRVPCRAEQGLRCRNRPERRRRGDRGE